MSETSKQHSSLIRETLGWGSYDPNAGRWLPTYDVKRRDRALAALDGLEEQLRAYEKIDAERNGQVKRLMEQVQSLEREKVELELAGDHHRMFWQQAEERERGLKEQLEAVTRERDEFAEALHNASLSVMRGRVESSPAIDLHPDEKLVAENVGDFLAPPADEQSPASRPLDPKFPNHVEGCICPRFKDIAPDLIADLTCPVHGVNGTHPGDVLSERSPAKKPEVSE